MTAAEFGRLLAGPVKRRGAWFDALCPVPSHGDTRPSLSFRDGDRGVIVKCRAGCQPAEIAHAVGHTVADLFFDGNGQSPPRERVTLAAFAAAKALPVNFLRARGVEEDGDGLRITYRLRDGSLAPRQRRRWALAAKEGSAWEGPTGISPVAYGPWQLDAVMEKGELLLVEGETDALAAWYHNVPCLGLPGSDTAKLLTLDALEGIACLYIIQEPDRGGETFVAGIAARLTTLGWTGQAFVVRLPTKDLHELHVQAGVAFADQLQAAQAAGERLPLTSRRGCPRPRSPAPRPSPRGPGAR